MCDASSPLCQSKYDESVQILSWTCKMDLVPVAETSQIMEGVQRHKAWLPSVKIGGEAGSSCFLFVSVYVVQCTLI